jgi:hypothetical protein
MGLIYIGVISLSVNIIIAVAGSWAVSAMGAFREGLINESELVEN